MAVKVTVYEDPGFVKRVVFEGFDTTMTLPSSPGLEVLGITAHRASPGSQHLFVASIAG